MQRNWWKEAVCYQVYPRSFQDTNGDGIGDLKGVTQRLDYLKELGIDVIWLSPMFKSPNDDNGYDISDYQDIMDEFGTMADFDELLTGVHARGMKLILDLVINHTSDEHPWFIESKSSKHNPKRDWYIWRDGKDGQEPNNWESIFDTPAWQYNEATDDYYLHVFSPKQPDLNWENPDVRNALHDMVNWWLDKGIDGFRVDAISHIKKDQTFKDAPSNGARYVKAWDQYMNVEGIDTFLAELHEQTFQKYDVMTVGEANGVGINDIEKWVNERDGYFNMIFQFETLGLWSVEEQKLDVLALKKGLTRWQQALAEDGSGWNALFIENHDQPRAVSTWGNEAYWQESAKALAVMYFFMKGTPFIYQGQEIGMTNTPLEHIEDYQDIQTTNQYRKLLAEGVAEEEAKKTIWKTNRGNARIPMQWSTENYAGFSTVDPWVPNNPNYETINVAQQLQDEQSILVFYQRMIALRKSQDVLVYGRYDLIHDTHPQVYAYTRTLADERIVIISNLTATHASLPAVTGIQYDTENLLLATHSVNHTPTATIELQPYEARIYKI